MTRVAPTLLDGGTGSELRRRGIGLTAAAWSAPAALEHRDLLVTIHREYVDAGADVITASTFAASPFVLEAIGLGERFEDANRAAIGAARDAVASARAVAAQAEHRNIRIAASLSCYPPVGGPRAYPPPEAELAAYRRWTGLFADTACDLILVEMMQETDHAERACRAASESGLPFWLGVSCRRHPQSGELVGFDRVDTPFTQTLERLIAFEPAAVTVMHSPIEVVDEALAIVADRWGGPRGAYPALPYREDPDSMADSGPPPTLAPDAFVDHLNRWVAAGATIVGGCCGTAPAHIAAARARLDESTA